MPRSLARWMALCALAEAVGMTAVASAARLGDRLVTPPHGVAGTAALVGLAVAGGVVEALALGAATARALRATVRGLPVRRWIVVTTLVAGLSWAAGSLPSALAGDAADTGSPAPALILAGAAGIGLGTGALLGAAQSLVLRGRARHPWRWAVASTAAWPLPMVVIFAGATLPGAEWSPGAVLLLAAATGAVAGAALGLGLAAFAPSLQGTSASGRVVLHLLRHRPGRALLPGVVGIRVRGVRTGEWHALPVLAAPDAGGLVVLVGDETRKTWWRNLLRPAAVAVLTDGTWRGAVAEVVAPGEPDHDRSAAVYRARFGRAPVAATSFLVRVRPGLVPDATDLPEPLTDQARSRA
jgi:hypothetical protein